MTVQPKCRALFAENAAPVAIQAELRNARAARDRAERDITWLTDLLIERAEQIRAGTWPAPVTTQEGTKS